MVCACGGLLRNETRGLASGVEGAPEYSPCQRRKRSGLPNAIALSIYPGALAKSKRTQMVRRAGNKYPKDLLTDHLLPF